MKFLVFTVLLGFSISIGFALSSEKPVWQSSCSYSSGSSMAEVEPESEDIAEVDLESEDIAHLDTESKKKEKPRE